MWYLYITIAIMLIVFLYAMAVYVFTAAAEAFKQYLVADGYKDAALWLIITAICAVIAVASAGGATSFIILIISTWRW